MSPLGFEKNNSSE